MLHFYEKNIIFSLDFLNDCTIIEVEIGTKEGT